MSFSHPHNFKNKVIKLLKNVYLLCNMDGFYCLILCFKRGTWGVPTMASKLRIRYCLCGSLGSIPGTVQWLKNPVLPQLWCRLQLWLGFDPWPRVFHISHVQQKKKKKKVFEITTMGFFNIFPFCRASRAYNLKTTNS